MAVAASNARQDSLGRVDILSYVILSEEQAKNLRIG